MKTYTSKYRRLAIINMYRSGASLEQISVIQCMQYEKVKAIIEAYFKIKISSLESQVHH